MEAHNPQYAPEPDWEDVYADPAVKGLTRCVPQNKADYQDEVIDERVRENMRQQSAWMKRILAAAIAED